MMNKELSNALTKLKKTYKDSIPSVEVAGVVPRLILSSPQLNYIFGGGFPMGRVVELLGPESGGKCYHPDTKVETDKGLLSFRELFTDAGIDLDETEEIIPATTSIKVKDHKGEWKPILNYTKNGVKEVKTITTNIGTKITATTNNPFYVYTENSTFEWRELSELKVGDYLVKHRKEPYSPKVFHKEAYSLGILVADGYFNNSFIAVTNDDPSIKNYIMQEFPRMLGVDPKIYNKDNSQDFRFYKKEGVNSFYNKYGFESGIAKNKKVPEIVFRSDKDFMASFLQGYLDCESSVDKRGIEVSSASEELLYGIHMLLDYLGYISFISQKKVKAYPDNWYGRISLRGRSCSDYLSNIGFVSELRKTQSQEFVFVGESNHDTIPYVSNLYKNIYSYIPNRTKKTYKKMQDGMERNIITLPSINRVKKYFKENNYNEALCVLEATLPLDYYFDRIVSIEEINPIITCDMEVGDSHSFIANGVISHNTVISSYIGGQVQKRTDGPSTVLYLDIEHTFDKKYAQTAGLDLSEDKLIFVRPLNGEEAFTIAEDLVKTGEIGLIVWDSVAATGSETEMEKEYGSANFGRTAALFSQGLRKINPYLSRYESSLLLLNQVRDKIGGYSAPGMPPPESSPGGRAIKFYASWRGRVSRIEDILDKKEVIGNSIRVKNIKSKIGFPKRSAELELLYGTGFSPDAEYISFIINLGLVKVAGSWISNEEWGFKGQGRDSLLSFLHEHPDIFNECKDIVNKSFTTHSILDDSEDSEGEEEDIEEETLEPMF